MPKKARAYARTTHQAASLLAAQIKEARLRRRWTARELATRAGISQPTLTRIERGDPTVAIGTVFDVAAILDVPLFFEDPGRLAPELGRARSILALLPQRVRREDDDDVDDDF